MKLQSFLFYCSVMTLFCWNGVFAQEPVRFMIHSDKPAQVVHHFGASDCWSCQFVGLWPDSLKNEIADLLFSMDVDESSNPEGIGLSLWRFNVGAGSAEREGEGTIGGRWRQTECLFTEDGTFKPDAQAGQRWFMKAARARGVQNLVGFVNSPPVFLTQNGKGYSSDGKRYNLREENYSRYVSFLTDVINTLQKEDGITLDYISPVNEPQWDWMKNDQEGSPALNSEIYKVVKLLNNQLENDGLKTKIEVTEAAKIDFLFRNGGAKKGRENQIEEFFGARGKYNLRQFGNVSPTISGHSYFTTFPAHRMFERRKAFRHYLDSIAPDIEYMMSEYCILENNKEIKGGGRDLGMDAALYMARVIHADLVYAGAASWQWWIAVSPYDYKDGLVYIDKSETGGKIFPSKMLWVLGNYSRFVRPGMRRIEVSRDDNLKDEEQGEELMVSGYLDDKNNKTVVVAINYSGEERIIELLSDRMQNKKKLNVYTTDCQYDLELTGRVSFCESVVIPPRSVITFCEE